MEVYRLCAARHADKLDGMGNRDTGARWNSAGNGVVYTAATVSLAILEAFVHLPKTKLPATYVLVMMHIPDALPIEAIALSEYPQGWEKGGHDAWFKASGDRWLKEGQALALRAPSLVNPFEDNVMLNPVHPAMSAVSIVSTQPFSFDPRLIS